MTGAHGSELLNPTTSRDLNEVLGPLQVTRLLKSFRSELRTAPADVRSAVEAGELARARSGAHRLKGAALCVGADAVATLASEIENASPGELNSLARRLTDVASATANLLAKSLLRDHEPHTLDL